MNELLKPRYKVIADYPYNTFTVGQVIDLTSVEPDHPFFQHLEKYPHLFRKLEWWEERDALEMPEYVKSEGIGMVIKVNKYNFIDNTIYISDVFTGKENCPLTLKSFLKNKVPSTSQDYETQEKGLLEI